MLHCNRKISFKKKCSAIVVFVLMTFFSGYAAPMDNHNVVQEEIVKIGSGLVGIVGIFTTVLFAGLGTIGVVHGASKIFGNSYLFSSNEPLKDHPKFNEGLIFLFLGTASLVLADFTRRGSLHFFSSFSKIQLLNPFPEKTLKEVLEQKERTKRKMEQKKRKAE